MPGQKKPEFHRLNRHQLLVGHSAHSDHSQVFALQAVLPTVPSADPEALLVAMRGQVQATGEIAGTYARPQSPVKR